MAPFLSFSWIPFSRLLLRDAVLEATKTSYNKNFVVSSCRRAVVSAEGTSRETFHRTG